MSSPGSWRLVISLATLYVVWGSTYLAIRVMVRTVPPLLGAGARFLIAGLVLAAVVRIQRADNPRLSRSQVASAGLVGLLILVGGIGLVTVAEREVPSALTALVIASIPLWVVILRLVHREIVPRTTVAAVVVGFVGLVVLLLPDQGARQDWDSLLLLVVAAVLTAIGAFYSKKMALPTDPFIGASIQMLVSGAVLLLVSALMGELDEASLSDVSTESLSAFAYLVTFGSLLAYSAFVWLLENAKVSTVATYAYVNPVVAVILGVLLLDERISGAMAFGAAVIVLSVVAVVRSERSAPSA